VTSRLGYLAAFLVLFLGVGGAIFFLSSRLGGMEDALKRAVVPGESVIALDQPGTYTIFHETNGTVDGVVYTAPDISGLKVAVQSADTGEAVPLNRTIANTTYEFGGSSGVGLFEFAVDKPGDYRLSAAYDDGRAEPRTILSLSSGFVGNLVVAILVTIGLVFGSIALAVALGVTTFVRRRRQQAAADAAGAA